MEELSMDEQSRNNNKRKKKVCLVTFLVAFWILGAFTAYNSWSSIKGHVQIKVNKKNMVFLKKLTCFQNTSK